MPEFPAPQGDAEADVCVIGGLTTAYLLSKEDKTVVLIDTLGIGAGETGRTTAHFFPSDDRYVEIERGFGAGNAQRVAGGRPTWSRLSSVTKTSIVNSSA